jgi:nucleotide-binding universal stress UspA family protein
MNDSPRFRRPLVALSLTGPDRDLLHYAAVAFGPDPSLAVRFLHVLPPVAGGVAGEGKLEGVRNTVRAALEEHAPALVRNAILDVREDAARVDGVLRAAAEHDSDVVMLGHRRARSGRRSLARRLALMAPSSVWLVPEGSSATLQRILVPTDFSASSADSLRVAAALAALHGLGHLTAVHVRFDPALSQYAEHSAEFRTVEVHDFEQFLAGVDTGSVRVDYAFEDSPMPAHALLRAAERLHADLIVMHTRGRSPAAAVLLGSVTSEVMAQSHLPVLAAKHDGRQLSLRQVLLSGEFWGGRRAPKAG